MEMLALIFAMAVASGCIGKGQTDAAPTSEDLSGSITIVGSSALQPLVEAAAQQFTSMHPDAAIHVQGGGSGTGLSSISEGYVDIGNADLFAEEKAGVDPSQLVDHKVAVTGMGPVTHPDTGVANISHEQLIDIFTGKVKNWKEVGGKDEEIVIIHRAKGSGTREVFEQIGLKEAEPAPGMEQDSSGTVRKIVSETPGAISYLSFSYFDDSVIALAIDGIEPTLENVSTNYWKIWAYQHMYTNGEPTGLTKSFLDYMLSDEVQEGLVPEMNYLPVREMAVERDAEGNVIEK